MKIPKLKTIDELSSSCMKLFSKEDVVKFAKENIIPHYIIINPYTKKEYGLLFDEQELDKWIRDNATQKMDGINLPELKFINSSFVIPQSAVPKELLLIKNLYEIPQSILNTPPGIYFLCIDGNIQYIGQAKHILNRILGHVNEGKKDFNSVFFIACPLHTLDGLESALIRKFKPPLNKEYILASDKNEEIVLNEYFK